MRAVDAVVDEWVRLLREDPEELVALTYYVVMERERLRNPKPTTLVRVLRERGLPRQLVMDHFGWDATFMQQHRWPLGQSFDDVQWTRWNRLARETKVGEPTAEPKGRVGRPPTTRVCSVEDCGRPHRALGFCTAHFYRFRTHGSPQAHIPVRKRAPAGAK